ncbi:MAG: protein translocase subunit SecF [Proteobacteria bacterium]|nr:protein translocase subunit SecF [Pseudomonadota bacterium]
MPFEIIRPGTQIDFIGRRGFAVLVSLALIAASAIAVGVRGVRWGIDFVGGNEVQVRFLESAENAEGQIRDLLGPLPGVSDLSVIPYGDDPNEYLIRFRGGLDVAVEEGADEATPTDMVVLMQRTLAGGIGAVDIQRSEYVGPRVGAELRRNGAQSLAWACLFILAYVAMRFSLRFAPGAVVALVHDVLLTAGILVLVGNEFDLKVLAALLATLGYSLNDTIIIYDRIRENLEIHTKADMPEVLNLSVNQTLSRTVLTSGTTLAALLSLLVLGGEVIRPFAFTMTVGVLVGTYSSAFIASPVLLWLESTLGATKDANKKTVRV